MLIVTLFLRLFEPDQSKIKEIVQEIVNIHNGAIFKNGTLLKALILSHSSLLAAATHCISNRSQKINLIF